jgi:hypothetical protein
VLAVITGTLRHLSSVLCLCNKVSQITGLIKENQAKGQFWKKGGWITQERDLRYPNYDKSG